MEFPPIETMNALNIVSLDDNYNKGTKMEEEGGSRGLTMVPGVTLTLNWNIRDKEYQRINGSQG